MSHVRTTIHVVNWEDLSSLVHPSVHRRFSMVAPNVAEISGPLVSTFRLELHYLGDLAGYLLGAGLDRED